MSTAYFYPQAGLQPSHEEPVSYNPRPSHDHRPPAVEVAIRQNWVTFIHDLDSSSVTPDTAQDKSLVNQAYREHLAANLQLSTPTLPLPSTDFWCEALAGFLFSQSLNWEHYISVGWYEAVTMIQAALLGQKFEKQRLVGCANLPWYADCVAGRFNMFQAGCASDHLDPGHVASDPDKAWKAVGSCGRTEPAKPYGVPLLHRLGPWPSLRLYLIPPPAAKGRRYTLQLTYPIIPQSGDFTPICNSSGSQHTNSLVHFYNSCISSNHRKTATTTTDPHLLPVLWHSLFISLSADLNRLELAIGKQGHDEAQCHTDYARRWACSPAGFRSPMNPDLNYLSILILNLIDQRANLINPHRDLIPIMQNHWRFLKVANPNRGSCEEDGACFKRRPLR
ncbi:hypothetical protein BJX62DRAFT_232549 [Aspergillus germanicus]